jgi:hypothetical protein
LIFTIREVSEFCENLPLESVISIFQSKSLAFSIYGIGLFFISSKIKQLPLETSKIFLDAKIALSLYSNVTNEMISYLRNISASDLPLQALKYSINSLYDRIHEDLY